LTPEQHNKYLGYAHIAYAGFFMVIMLFILVVIGVMMLASSGQTAPLLITMSIWVFIALFYAALIVPSFIAGYGLLKRKKWARTASIISAVLAAMQFPIGTAVCVYTFWFLFSEPGKAMFERGTYALPAGNQNWANQSWNYDARRQRDVQYDPPQSPPDWR